MVPPIPGVATRTERNLDMARTFIATILAASLAVTSFSMPARAGQNDAIAPIIAGAAALAVVGAIVHQKKKQAQRAEPVVPSPEPIHDRGHGYRGPQRGWQDGPGFRGRPGRVDRGPVHMPQSCRVVVPTRHGPVAGYAYSCVQRTARFADRIPGRCVTATGNNRGPRFIYDSRCLNRMGFRAF